MTGVVSGRESADADAQTTPEGEAEQLAIAALKAGVTKNCCRTRNASNIFKPFQDESVLPFVHLTFALHHSQIILLHLLFVLNALKGFEAESIAQREAGDGSSTSINHSCYALQWKVV